MLKITNINYNQFMNLNAFIVFSLRMHYIVVPFLFLFFQLLKWTWQGTQNSSVVLVFAEWWVTFSLLRDLMCPRRLWLWDEVPPAKSPPFLPSRRVIPPSAKGVLHALKGRWERFFIAILVRQKLILSSVMKQTLCLPMNFIQDSQQ